MHRDEKAHKTLDRYSQLYMRHQQREENLRWRILTAKTSFSTIVSGARLFINQMRLSYILQQDELHDVLSDMAGNMALKYEQLAHIAKYYKGRSLWYGAKLAFFKARSYSAWEVAKSKSDYSYVAPAYKRLFKACFNGAAHAQSYDEVLGEKSRGLKGSDVERLMGDSFRRYVSLNSAFHKTSAPQKNFDIKRWQLSIVDQRRVVKRLMKDMGVDFTRLTQSDGAHPACFGFGDQVYLSMRYDANDVLKTILDAVHEAGHALYRQNVAQNHAGQSAAMIAGRDMDEAMALFWEQAVTRNDGFAAYLASIIAHETKGHLRLSSIDIHEYLLARSTYHDRASADIINYPLHSIMRRDVMNKLFALDGDVMHLPQIFNESSVAYLGHMPQSDCEGVLQDPHWFAGEFADFDNYFMGQQYALHLYESMCRTLNEDKINADFVMGDFTQVYNWLDHNVWQYGALCSSKDIMRVQGWSGKDARAYTEFVTRKLFLQ